jgi:L-aminopeptidase/D-esterase-like protein
VITDVPGIEVGHWTDAAARTGCTVVLVPQGAVASGEIRGGAPATREFALLDPSRTVPFVDAVVLSGGSAFGLAAGDGVMSWLEGQGRGFLTPGGPVPIVVGMSLYDLAVGDGSIRPGPGEGRAAAEAATGGTVATGAVGAGTGATVAKWRGPDHVQPGGIATATLRAGEVVAAALVAVNAYGSIDDGTTAADPGPPFRPAAHTVDDAGRGDGGNTTIGVVATNAVLSKLDCYLLAQSAHDGLARALMPAHTAVDGDGFVAVATGQVAADLVHLRVLVQQAVTRAVRSLAPLPRS